MKLSHTTTEADLVAPVAAARKRLADLASAGGHDSEALVAAAHGVIAAEEVARLRHEVVACLAYHHEKGSSDDERRAALHGVLLARLVRGADDTWSGRKNDARRDAFDAVRDEIRDLRWSLLR